MYADIVVMGADGGGRKVLTYSGLGVTDLAANKRAVYVMPLDGGKRRQVTDNGYAPIWSPDSDHLAFTRITNAAMPSAAAASSSCQSTAARPAQ